MGSLFHRLWYWTRRRRIERELQEEIEFHRSLREEALKRSGLPESDAALRSRRAMGNILLAREDARGVWISPALDQFWQDVVYGVRQLRRNRGFTALAVLTLAIGIGANSAVFTIVNAVLLESLPYKDPQRLVLLFEQLPNAPNKFGFSPPDFEFLRSAAKSFSGVAAYQTRSYELSGIAAPQRVMGARISTELFSVLGVEPALGRALTTEDDRRQSRVAVISNVLWARVFARDPLAVGKPIVLDRQPYTVVGVMRPSFQFPLRGPELNGEAADVFVPMAFSAQERQGFGMFYNNTLVARLKGGVEVDAARAEMTAMLKPLIENYPPVLAPFINGLSIPMSPFKEEVVGRSRLLLAVLFSAVGIVLLIACADVANLILTRSSSRQRELAIRSSLGAGSARILRQLMTEGLAIAGAGGALGLLVAYAAMKALLVLAGQTLPRAESIAFDYRVVGFTVMIAFATPLVFSALPALRTAFAADAEALKANAGTTTPDRGRSRMLGAFVIAQVALALVLSVGAGLLVRSFLRLLQTDPGFRPEQVASATVTLPSGRYATGPQMRSFHQKALETARRIPGVTAAGVGNDLPLNVRDRRAFTAQGALREVPLESRLIAPTWVSQGYLETLGVPLRRGRFFTDGDIGDSQPVVIINDVLARMLWPGGDPIGRRIKWGIEASLSPWMTVVGVVGNVKQSALNQDVMAQVYVPLLQQPLQGDFFRTVSIVVRSDRDAASLVSDLRGAIRSVDPELPVKAQSLTQMIGESLKPQRFSMTLVILFAAIAIALSAIGIYGVLANVVGHQRQEIGIRIALGATRGSVMWMVFRRALTLTAIGLAAGVAGAYATTGLMSALLYGVHAKDAGAFVGAGVALASVCLIASLIPAWRATRVDPLSALRAE